MKSFGVESMWNSFINSKISLDFIECGLFFKDQLFKNPERGLWPKYSAEFLFQNTRSSLWNTLLNFSSTRPSF